jgi:antitoxin component YwqK of YwqJK toxin-antitoxin module
MRWILFLLVFISVDVSAQWKSFTFNAKGDTLNRVDMKDRKQGPWSVHVDDLRGERGYEEEGYYENDQKEGTWKRYSLQGVKIAEENYRWGKLNGRQYYFTYNGGLMREESWRAMDPAVAFDTVAVYDLHDANKILNWVVVKNDGVSFKHGKWTYYDPAQGTIESTEQYVMNKLQADDGSVAGSADDIRPLAVSKGKNPSDTTTKKTALKPKEVMEYEKKNSGKKKIKARDGETGY